MKLVKPREYMTPNVADLLDKWNSRHRIDREVMGAIELAYMRGEHNGYLHGFKDAKRGRLNKFKDRL
jgi:hypothetical protein